METKICKKCNKNKSLEEYYKDASFIGGLKSCCKICYRNSPSYKKKMEYEKRWYLERTNTTCELLLEHNIYREFMGLQPITKEEFINLQLD
jgi:hypothetical protein